MKQTAFQKVFALFVASLLLAGTAFGQSSLDKKTLLTIGDEKVTVGEFMRIYEKNNTVAENANTAQDIKDYLDLFINFKLKVAEAEALKMDTLPDFIRELRGYREQLAKPYFVDESVNEALLKEAYDRMLQDVRASHILIMLDKDALPADTLEAYNRIMKIREEIMAGKDFAEAAVEYSDDPSARDREEIPGKQRFRPGNKGDLGYFTVFNMVYPFETAAYNTPVGEVSMPVRTQYGYHLVKVTDKREALGRAQVAHIFVRLPVKPTEEQVKQAQEKIDNIYEKLQNGMSFEDAVKEYSEDKGSAKNNGKLSKFTSNRVVPQFVVAAQELEVGEISEPVRTLYGFHIIKLLSREKPGTFEEEAPKLKERLNKDRRSHKSKDVVLAQIKRDYKLKIYEKNKAEFFAAVDSTVLTQDFKAGSLLDMDKVLFKIGKKKYTQADFARYLEDMKRVQENMEKDVYLEKIFNSFVDKKCLDYMDEHLEEMYPEFAELMEEYHDGILLFNLTDEKVWTKAVQDTAGLEDFFNKNRVKYMWDDRVDATVYYVRKKEDVDRVKKIITETESDGDIAKAFDRDSITSVRIVPDTFEKGDNKYVDQTEWEEGTVKEFPSDVEEQVVFVKIRKLRKPVAKTLEEARGQVTADYQNWLEEQWIQELREKYPVHVNQEVLEELLQQQTSR